jgi:HEAT repeat protein
MSRRYLAVASALSTCVLLAAAAAAQQPRISNGQVSSRPAPELARTFQSVVAAQSDVGWIGYAVPVNDRERTMCCWSSGNGTTYFSGTMSSGDAPCCGSCRIEPESNAATSRPAQAASGAAPGPVKLEGAERMVVLFRIASREIERIRTFSEDCELDAGGRPVVWLQDVRPADSVAFLASLLSAQVERKNRITNAALSAIAFHAEPSAGPVLERFATTHEVPGIRGEALFWMAQRGDVNAAPVILNALNKDPAADVRKRAVFALSQLKNDAGVEPLIRTGRTHQDAAVRGEAIFWLGQKAGRKAVATITDAIEQDPETDVKKRALFALSQLPKSEGVPLLIDIARKNTNPAVRKQAIFWLGQSKDPRAVEFFAEILK